jgi:hypothetical protein
MYKHIQGRTSFFTPARFKSCLFFKFFLISLWVHVVLYSGEFLTKTTAAPSQEVVEGGSWYFLKRIRSWELNQTGFWIHVLYIRRNLKNKHDLKRAGVKKDVRPCICLYIDSIFTWIVTRHCVLSFNWVQIRIWTCINNILKIYI